MYAFGCKENSSLVEQTNISGTNKNTAETAELYFLDYKGQNIPLVIFAFLDQFVP